VASGELDDPHGGRGSPTRSSSVGRARERERGYAKWDVEVSPGAGGAQKKLGPWAGEVAEDPGECVRVHARWSTVGGGPTAQRERERGRTRVTARRTDKAGPRGRGGEGRGGEGNWCRQPGPTGKREGKSECAGKGPPLTGGTHLSGDVGARARGLAGSSWAGWAALAFSFSLDFLICFSIPFSLGFLIQI
jgi:hypothetical protein